MRILTPITDPHNCGKRRPDLTGRRFGRLVAIREAGRSGNHVYWECRCDCGGIKITQTSSLLHGSTQSCNCLAIRRPGQAAAHHLYLVCRRNAIVRNLSFELTESEWYTFTQHPCFYCGTPPVQNHGTHNYRGAFIYNGIDRKDNEQGYSSGNCVSCCKQCNQAKKAMSYGAFVVWLKRIAARWG